MEQFVANSVIQKVPNFPYYTSQLTYLLTPFTFIRSFSFTFQNSIAVLILFLDNNIVVNIQIDTFSEHISILVQTIFLIPLPMKRLNIQKYDQNLINSSKFKRVSKKYKQISQLKEQTQKKEQTQRTDVDINEKKTFILRKEKKEKKKKKKPQRYYNSQDPKTIFSGKFKKVSIKCLLHIFFLVTDKKDNVYNEKTIKAEKENTLQKQSIKLLRRKIKKRIVTKTSKITHTLQEKQNENDYHAILYQQKNVLKLIRISVSTFVYIKNKYTGET
eukprot:TRINITY_DN5510_c0_g1_i5.p1 TRINITY_DN5510_c0_g1~~TRINITY_DN5510_c0_g1_i5.p1  ORF type:complete len:273 (+),score=-1.43 TRINITY_DN5510_c0_g1_i5:224-1042(+)